jgi:hypothetical protein
MKNSIIPKRRGSFLEIGGNFGSRVQSAYKAALRKH